MSSGFSVPDGRAPVNMPTPARLAGRGTLPPRFDWAIADIRRDYAHQAPAVLLQEADDLAHLPPLLRDWAWWRLAAVAIEAAERLTALQVVDGGEEAA